MHSLDTALLFIYSNICTQIETLIHRLDSTKSKHTPKTDPQLMQPHTAALL